MQNNKRNMVKEKFTKPASILLILAAISVASCSNPEPAKINPVTGGGRNAISKKPAREDLAILVNGKQWDGLSDVDGLKYRVVGE